MTRRLVAQCINAKNVNVGLLFWPVLYIHQVSYRGSGLHKLLQFSDFSFTVVSPQKLLSLLLGLLRVCPPWPAHMERLFQ